MKFVLTEKSNNKGGIKEMNKASMFKKLVVVIWLIFASLFLLTACSDSVEYKETLKPEDKDLSKRDFSLANCLSWLADPIDSASGAQIIEKSVFKLKGAQFLEFKVSYNSMILNKGALGVGWNHNFEMSLEKLENNDIIVHWNTNRGNLFKKQADNEYISTEFAVRHHSLVQNEDGTYTLTSNDHMFYIFSSSGQLIKEGTGHGLAFDLSYNNEGKLEKVTEPLSGQTITLSYNSQGYVESVKDNINREVRFKYNDKFHLISITNPSKKSDTFTYTDNGKILTHVDPNGNLVFSNTYDDAGRIATQDDGISENKLVTLKYEQKYSEDFKTDVLVTNVTDREGNNKIYVHSLSYKLLGMQDHYENKTGFSIDENGNRIREHNALGDTKKYEYDSCGNIIAVTDENSYKTSFTYDNKNNLTSVTDNAGNTVVNKYFNNNNIESTKDQLGNTTSYTYNENGLPISKTVTGQGTTTYTYENGKLVKQVDPLGGCVLHSYDDIGRSKTTTDKEGNTISYEYDDLDNILSVTDQLGKKTTYTYDNVGNKLTQTDERGNITYYTYNGNNRLTEEKDALGNITKYEYDGEDRLIKTTYADKSFSATIYDKVGRVQETTDPEGNKTNYTYDECGRVSTKTVSGFGATTYTYYENGKLKAEKDAKGNVTKYTYDYAGRLLNLTEPDNSTTSYEYDPAGNLKKVTNPMYQTISYTYDSLGNKLSMTDARGYVTKYSYDKNRNLTCITDPLGNKTQYIYDKEGRLKKIVDAKGNTTTNDYDLKGRVNKVTDALGNSIEYVYDDAGNLQEKRDAYGRIIFKADYNKVNCQVTQTDALGNKLTLAYDNMYRLTDVTDSNSKTQKYSYDNLGRLKSVTDKINGVSKQTFNTLGMLVSTTDSNNNSTLYDYDELGRLKAETNEAGGKISYEYDTRSLINKVINGRNQESTFTYNRGKQLEKLNEVEGMVSYTYDENGNVLTVKDGNGTTTREYDALNRVTKYTDFRGNTIQYSYDELGNLIMLTYPGGRQVRYGYDAVNRLSSVTDWAGRTTRYGYDRNGRLFKTIRPNNTVMITKYDAAGNLTEQKDVDKNGNVLNYYSYSYDSEGNVVEENSANEPQPFSNPNATMTYDKYNRLALYDGQAVTYDADGNMITGPLGSESASFTYDSRNRLKSAGNINYKYDAEDNRVSVTESTNTTDYVINPHAAISQTLIKKDSNGNQTYYIYGLGLIGQEEFAGEYKSYHYDMRGSTTAISDMDGKVTDRVEYARYGEKIMHAGNTLTPFLFNGRDGVMTDNNGLYYMRARYYNLVIKRFINQDIVHGSISDGRTLNRYAYANGNPVSNIDPFGTAAENALAGIKQDLNCFITDFAVLRNDVLDATRDISPKIHFALDVAGNFPVMGEGFDLANAAYYYFEGDFTNGTISLCAAGIGVGSAVVAPRMSKYLLKYGETSEKLIYKGTSVTINTAADGLSFGNKLPVSSLNKRQSALLELLSEPGNTAIVRKKSVSMNDLRQLTNVTGDEFSMFTNKGERLLIRGKGNTIDVSKEMYADLVAGKYGKFSGHTHPGYSLNPGPVDEGFLNSLQWVNGKGERQMRSSVWGNTGEGWYAFGTEPWLTQEVRAQIRSEKYAKYYGDR